MSEHENGNFVLKCGQNQQKYQSFMAISDFALLYRIRPFVVLFDTTFLPRTGLSHRRIGRCNATLGGESFILVRTEQYLFMYRSTAASLVIPTSPGRFYSQN